MHRTLRSVALLLVLSNLVSAPARAVTLTIHFTGTVFAAEGSALPFVSGGSGSGSFQIDAETSDSAPFPGVGIYRGADNFSFNFDGYTASSTGGSADDFIRIDDVVPPMIGVDLFTARSADAAGPVLLGSYEPTALELVLRGSSATAFTSEALPTALDLSSFDLAFASIRFGFDRVDLFLTSLTVPEPAQLLLLALSGLGLRWSRRG